jgi:phage terminase small subunit
MQLKPKQIAFAHAYIETGSASEAYRRCYDVAADTKPTTINVKACELLGNQKVAAYVGELQAEHRKRHAQTVDRIVAELSEFAFADVGKQASTELGAEHWAKLRSKLDALDGLARHLGLFKEMGRKSERRVGEAALAAP